MYNYFIKIILCSVILFGSEYGYAKQQPRIGLTFNKAESNKQNIQFNFLGLKRGSVFTSCYHNPCSISKIISFRKISESANKYSRIKIRLLGGEKPWNSTRTKWNSRPHTVIVNCSIQHPFIYTSGQTTLIPLGSETGIPGVLVSSAELYLFACHNFRGSFSAAAAKYGYQVQD
jgi:hypothetical protein